MRYNRSPTSGTAVPSINACGHPDGYENAGEFDAEFGHVARWWRAAEPGRVLVVHACEVGRVGEQYAHLDNALPGCARGPEDGAAVGERLSGLFLDRRSGQAPGR